MTGEPAVAAEDPEATAARRPPGRSRGSVANMARSLAVLVVILFAIGGFILFQPRPHDAVRAVDIRPVVAEAQAAHAYAVASPHGLPAGWRATSARDRRQHGVLEVHLGYVTPTRHYAAVEQSNGDAASFLGGSQVLGHAAQPTGTVAVHGVDWQRYRTATGTALVREGGAVTTAVLGTAPLDELVTLAASLR